MKLARTVYVLGSKVQIESWNCPDLAQAFSGHLQQCHECRKCMDAVPEVQSPEAPPRVESVVESSKVNGRSVVHLELVLVTSGQSMDAMELPVSMALISRLCIRGSMSARFVTWDACARADILL